MQLTSLKAQSRKLSDSRANVRLRKSGQIPAVYYGHGQTPMHVSVNDVSLRNVFAPGKRYTLIDLEIDGQGGNPAIIHDYQKDAISLDITHVDFLKIDESTEIKVRIPVRLVGLPVGVKTEGGILQQDKRYVHILCKPADIPAEIVVTVDDFHAGTAFYAKDLDIGKAKLATPPKTSIFAITKKSQEKEDSPAVEAPKAEAAAPAAAGAAKAEEKSAGKKK
ncbi:MAG TPA: 50S ribosomal protein L25 [Fibrobacteraceae bacterium]|nr:50S ribosomal protein L25 [Fibrobacteraceae bacterium]